MKTPLAGLAALFLVAHLVHLPPSLEDIDSVNFALGVREFDVARHQPHPPGYPVFIALAKLATGVLGAAGVPDAPVRALAVLSAIAGAALVPLLFVFFRHLFADPRLAWWGTAVTVASPLFWFSALRPLSDMTGLAFAVAVQLLLLPLILDRRARAAAAAERSPVGRPAFRLLVAAALCGVAAGVRSQTLMLTAPLLAVALLLPDARIAFRHRAAALPVAALGAVAWAVPLVAATGGLQAFAVALGAQAGEDFAGVVMLWTHPQPRVALGAFLNTFVLPWGGVAIGTGVLALGSVGGLRAAARAPRIVLVLLIAFGPYAIFHLLFQETITMRYALPLVPPAAGLAMYGAASAGRIGVTAAGAVLVLLTLGATVPAARAYGTYGSPAFRLFEDALLPARPEVIGLHGVMRRVEEWERDRHRAAVLRAPHGHEWLRLVEHWRERPRSQVHFVADPRRTDLALFDPQSRRLAASARWTFPEVPFVAGTRPGAADLHVMAPPGWMLDRGWALTAEIGGVTARDGLGPAVQPAIAWVRARHEAAALLVGGRNLAAAGGPAARLTLSAGTGVLDAWEAGPGAFFRHVVLRPGALAGSGYVPLEVRATASGGTGPVPPVSLEQFDLQAEGIVMVGLLDGWHEPEYSLALGRAWRWVSDDARLWVRPVGRDVVLKLAGESPLQYFDRAPDVRVTAAGAELARFSPDADFAREIVLPAERLAAAGGIVQIQTDLWFSPAERGGGATDRRRLSLRIFDVSVEAGN